MNSFHLSSHPLKLKSNSLTQLISVIFKIKKPMLWMLFIFHPVIIQKYSDIKDGLITLFLFSHLSFFVATLTTICLLLKLNSSLVYFPLTLLYMENENIPHNLPLIHLCLIVKFLLTMLFLSFCPVLSKPVSKFKPWHIKFLFPYGYMRAHLTYSV